MVGIGFTELGEAYSKWMKEHEPKTQRSKIIWFEYENDIRNLICDKGVISLLWEKDVLINKC